MPLADPPVLQLCGWHVDMVDTWREKVRKGDKVRFHPLRAGTKPEAPRAFYERANSSPSVQGLRWIFRTKTPEALSRFTEPLPTTEVCSLSKEVGPPRADPDFQPIGHVSLVNLRRVGWRIRVI